MNDERRDYRLLVTTMRVMDVSIANVTVSMNHVAIAADHADGPNEEEAVVNAVRAAFAKVRERRKEGATP